MNSILIQYENKEILVTSLEELRQAKEDVYDDGYFLQTFMNLKENIYSPLSKDSSSKSILNLLKEENIDISEFKRDKPSFTSINTNLIEAIVSKEEMQIAAEHENYNQKDFVLISIQDPDDKDDLSAHHKKFKDVLSIRFWDVEEDIGVKSGGFPVIPLNDDEAKKIADFIYKNKDEKFFIHCAAGVSRSAGVGLSVDCIINHNGSKYNAGQFPSEIKNHFRYSPNFVVYDKVIENFKRIEQLKYRCESCDSSFEEPIKGLKEGKETFSCPSCFNEI